MQKEQSLKEFLDSQYNEFNNLVKLHDYPDPLSIVYKHLDSKHIDELALICALYAYGNVKLILKNLSAMPFEMLDKNIDDDIEKFPYYRFQTRHDTRTCFLALRHAIKCGGIRNIFMESFHKNKNVIDAIYSLINFFYTFMKENNLLTNGSIFLFGNPLSKTSPLKRYNMFLRWMSRKDNIDLGLWSMLPRNALVLPLDTHTFRISSTLGLCTLKSANIKAAMQITSNLLKFDSEDPIKYDFALYRIGQLNLLNSPPSLESAPSHISLTHL